MASIPHIAFVGYQDSGKTTLICRVIERIKAETRLRVGTLKHGSHEFEIDYPGKDTWKYREAGADALVISSPSKIASIERVEREHLLDELLPRFSHVDLLLIEGFKRSLAPKIVVLGKEGDVALLREVENAVAVAAPFPPPSNMQPDITWLHRDDVATVSSFVIKRLCHQ